MSDALHETRLEFDGANPFLGLVLGLVSASARWRAILDAAAPAPAADDPPATAASTASTTSTTGPSAASPSVAPVAGVGGASRPDPFAAAATCSEADDPPAAVDHPGVDALLGLISLTRRLDEHLAAVPSRDDPPPARGGEARGRYDVLR